MDFPTQKYTLDIILQYTPDELDAFISQFTNKVYEIMDDKRYITMFYLYKYNLLDKEMLINNEKALNVSDNVRDLINREKQISLVRKQLIDDEINIEDINNMFINEIIDFFNIFNANVNIAYYYNMFFVLYRDENFFKNKYFNLETNFDPEIDRILPSTQEEKNHTKKMKNVVYYMYYSMIENNIFANEIEESKRFIFVNYFGRLRNFDLFENAKYKAKIYYENKYGLQFESLDNQKQIIGEYLNQQNNLIMEILNTYGFETKNFSETVNLYGKYLFSFFLPFQQLYLVDFAYVDPKNNDLPTQDDNFDTFHQIMSILVAHLENDEYIDREITFARAWNAIFNNKYYDFITRRRKMDLKQKINNLKHDVIDDNGKIEKLQKELNDLNK